MMVLLENEVVRIAFHDPHRPVLTVKYVPGIGVCIVKSEAVHEFASLDDIPKPRGRFLPRKTRKGRWSITDSWRGMGKFVTDKELADQVCELLNAADADPKKLMLREDAGVTDYAMAWCIEHDLLKSMGSTWRLTR